MNVNTLIFETENKDQTEKLLLINLLGITEALIGNLINLEEAENILFTPYTMDLLQKKKISDDVINIIHLGTELEDVLSTIPDKYLASLLEMRNLTLACLKSKKETIIENKVLRKAPK